MCVCLKSIRNVFVKARKEKLQYPEDAYLFVRETVTYAISHLDEARHISAYELLENCRAYAEEQYGPLAQTVLESWRIKCADDIGNIVYDLIESGKLGAAEGDSREDFSINFDLFNNNKIRIKHEHDRSKPLIVD